MENNENNVQYKNKQKRVSSVKNEDNAVLYRKNKKDVPEQSQKSPIKDEKKINLSPNKKTKNVESAKEKSGEKKEEAAPTPEMIRNQKRKAARKKMMLNNFKNVAIIMVIVVGISLSIATWVISCVNDVLAIKVSDKDKELISVTIDENMNTSQVIDRLDEAGVIKNAWFCKFFAEFVGYSNDGYISGNYDFSRSMGLENMLKLSKNNFANKAKTVKLTFPEGYTAEQIINLLDENKVCEREKFIETMNNTDFTKEYEFVRTMANLDKRYMRLEGFLFPDTYEFYVGEDPISVLKKFLTNFNNKWDSDYGVKAQKLGLTVDQVIILASIVQAESYVEDMPVVASILHNRIKSGMRLDCDSTRNYVLNHMSNITEEQKATYSKLYNTYECDKLPVGAICNPGIEAIESIINPATTDYFYFIHDAENVFRVARNLNEHEDNIATYGVAQS